MFAVIKININFEKHLNQIKMEKEEYYLDYTNKKWLWMQFDAEEQVQEVSDYLQKNNLKIRMLPGKESTNVYLEGVDLSSNGYCFRPENLLNHVRYFRKLKDISETNDFKTWLEKFNTYNAVKRYVIEKDQRWIQFDKII